jgi:hypothetical protein
MLIWIQIPERVKAKHKFFLPYEKMQILSFHLDPGSGSAYNKCGCETLDKPKNIVFVVTVTDRCAVHLPPGSCRGR